jgi:hypothetical protein
LWTLFIYLKPQLLTVESWELFLYNVGEREWRSGRMNNVIQNRVPDVLLAQEIQRETFFGSRVEITLEQAAFLGLRLDRDDEVVGLPESVVVLENLKGTANKDAVVPPLGYVCVLGQTVMLYWPFYADRRVVRFVS